MPVKNVQAAVYFENRMLALYPIIRVLETVLRFKIETGPFFLSDFASSVPLPCHDNDLARSDTVVVELAGVLGAATTYISSIRGGQEHSSWDFARRRDCGHCHCVPYLDSSFSQCSHARVVGFIVGNVGESS